MSFRKLQKTNEAQNDFGKKIKKFVMLVLENMIDRYFGYIFELHEDMTRFSVTISKILPEIFIF